MKRSPRETGTLVSMMRTTILLVVLACLITLPAASAEPDRADEDVTVGDVCVDVDYTTMPPVSVYECYITDP